MAENDVLLSTDEIREKVQQQLESNNITIDSSKIKVNDNGNVQIDVPNVSASITYNYYNNDYSMGITYVGGTEDHAGQSDESVIPAGSKMIKDYNFEKENDYYSVTYVASSNINKENNDTVNAFVSALELDKNEERHIFAGASAGPTTLIKTVSDYSKPCDVVLCDAQENCKYFVDEMLKPESAEIRNTLRDNGGVIIAYESKQGRGAGSPLEAVDHLMRLVDDGADSTIIKNSNLGTINKIGEEPLRVIVGLNDSVNTHSTAYGLGSITAEYYMTGQEMDDIYNGFENAPYANDEDGKVVYKIKKHDQYEVNGHTINGNPTKYYNLSSVEFLSGEYKYDAATNTYYINDENGNKVDLSFKSVEEIQTYFNTARSKVENVFIEMGKTDVFDKLDENSFSNISAGLGGMTYVNYSGLVDDVNNFIDTANKTTCANKGSSDYAYFGSHEEGKIDYPDSLNTSNAFLYGITSKLLGDIKTDVNSLQNVLNGKIRLEQYLVSQTELLTEGTSISNGADVGLKSAYFEELRNSYSGVFSNDVMVGNVGKISIDDLMQAVSSNGVLMSGLNNEIDDSDRLIGSINQIVQSLNANGEDWQTIKNHLEGYVSICEARKKACNTLKTAYVEASELIRNYINPDSYLDDGEIPEYVEKINNLTRDIDEAKARIESLQASNASLRNVGPDCVTWHDEKGFECTYCDFSPVYAAQDQIAANNQTIAVLNAQINVATEARKVAQEKLDKLNGFAEVQNKANNVIENALAEVESIYGGAVNNFTPVVC